ncbi:MAG: pyrimidine-nucleoside phosphorylase [Lachnospiraceae bacterium]|nr:pyrimidine-nucleoside phosphorylase [Lachnospiraceae bacterium]
MLMVDLIKKKRDGQELSTEEINFIIEGYVKGEIPDYQVSALMMAIFYQGMNDRETVDLTMAMMNSGDVLDLSKIEGVKVDKHSTGGVGDKTSLVLTPMVASLGIPVAKMSGRGLGHTGGTIDKLESFEGFSTSISTDKFFENVNNNKISIMGQTANLAPADKLLYALRDVTATVDNMSLIASSIMSKKLAAGADAIVLDVKSGSGAFMKNDTDAKALAEKMVSIGNMAGRKTRAVISDMDQPLGFAVGNALEVVEAINTLKGQGPDDLLELCLTLGSQMVILAGLCDDEDTARKMLLETIESGKALDKLATFIESQGGNKEDVYNTENLFRATICYELLSETDGYVKGIECEEVGMASLLLGGGRRSKTDEIDLWTGIILNKKVGDKVEKGECIAKLYANDNAKLEQAKTRLFDAYSFSSDPVNKNVLIKEIIK